MNLTIGCAAVVALYYWFCWWDFSHPISSVAWAQDCVWIGVIMGAILGDVQTGLVVGGMLALTFICALPVGANCPVDYAAAALAGVTMAIRFKWSAGLAISVAVFFGIGGAKLDGLRRSLATRFNDSAREHIRSRKYNLLFMDAVLSPILLQFFLRAIPMFLAIYLGGNGMDRLVQIWPPVLTHALNMAGGVLPGLGLALCLNTIGRFQVFPFFVIGFFFSSLVQGSMLPYVGIALCIAILYVRLTQPKQEGPAIDKSLFRCRIEDGKLSKKDHFFGYARFAFMHRNAQAMDTFYGTGMAFSYKNVLRKIYADDDAYQMAMERHLEPFIPECIWGSSILGIVVKEEEKLAELGETDGSSISALKTSLMGPVAGFGDSINYMVFWNLLKITFYPLAAMGSFLGMLTPVILHPALEWLGWQAYKSGYNGGARSIVAFLKSNIKNRILIGASVMGYFLLGAICNFTVSLELATPTLQGALDAAIPGLLPFLVTCGFYFYLRKGGKFLRMMVYCIAIMIVLCLIGLI